MQKIARSISNSKCGMLVRRLVLFLTLLFALCLPFAALATERPNIVFVLTDDMGYSDPNCYGGNFAPTPNIDRLAKEGVRFTHFYDSAPIRSEEHTSELQSLR